MQAYTEKAFYGWGYLRSEVQETPQKIIEQYRKEVNPNVWVHSIDLAGYGTQQFIGKNTNLIGGWSERVLQFIQLAEEGMDTLVKEIESYKW